MNESLRQLLFDPEAFFETGTPSLRIGAVVPVALGVLSLGVFPLFLALLRSPEVPEEAILEAFRPIRYATTGFEVSLPGAYGIFLVTLFVAPLVYWLAYAVVYHVLSWPVADRGGLGSTAAAIGVGFFPLLLANVVVVAALLVTYPSAPETVWVFGFSPPAQLYAFPPDPGPFFTGLNVLTSLCALWTGYIWLHALAAVRGITLRQSLVIVAVPVVFTLGPL